MDLVPCSFCAKRRKRKINETVDYKAFRELLAPTFFWDLTSLMLLL